MWIDRRVASLLAMTANLRLSGRASLSRFSGRRRASDIVRACMRPRHRLGWLGTYAGEMTVTKFPIALALLVASIGAAHAQQPANPLLAPATATSPGYDRCILSAVANADVYKDPDGIQFRCYGEAAEKWFNQLTGDREVKEANGVFIARYFDGSGYCAHQTKTATGADISSYLCAIDRPALK